MSEQQSFVDPVNYFEGDRVRITADPLMKAKVWVGRTGTVTKGSGRRFTEGVNVRLDRPIGRYTNLWFRHSEVEFEDNRKDRPETVLVGDYLRTNGSPVSCMGAALNAKSIPWVRSRSQRVNLNRLIPADFDTLDVECIDCGWMDEIAATQVERVMFMHDQPALPDGSYHADLLA